MKYDLVLTNTTTGHRHKQLHLEHKNDLFKCDGCKQVGFGSRYSCKEPSCARGRGFHLHKGCAKPASRRTHYLYEGRIFEFRNKGNKRKYCDACGGDFEGYFYQGYWDGKGHRERERRDLHLCCMALESEIRFSQFVKQGKQSKKDDISDVVLLLRKELPLSTKCALCHRKKVDGKKTWAYVSDCNTYGYHVHCLRSKVLELLETLLVQGKLKGTAATGRREINWPVEALFGSGASSTFPLPMARIRSGERTAAHGHGVARIIKISKMLVSIVVAVFLGNPVSATVAVITAVMSL